MGLAKPGSTRVLKHFPGHGWHSGTVMSFCRPHFLIKYRDGDTEDPLGYQLAAVLVLRLVAHAPGRRGAVAERVRALLPHPRHRLAFHLAQRQHQAPDQDASVADFLTAVPAKLHDAHMASLDAARAKRTIANANRISTWRSICAAHGRRESPRATGDHSAAPAG